MARTLSQPDGGGGTTGSAQTKGLTCRFAANPPAFADLQRQSPGTARPPVRDNYRMAAEDRGVAHMGNSWTYTAPDEEEEALDEESETPSDVEDTTGGKRPFKYAQAGLQRGGGFGRGEMWNNKIVPRFAVVLKDRSQGTQGAEPIEHPLE